MLVKSTKAYIYSAKTSWLFKQFSQAEVMRGSFLAGTIHWQPSEHLWRSHYKCTSELQ